MRPPILVLAMALLVPAAASAQPLDVTGEPDPLTLEGATPQADAGELAGEIKSKRPLALQPQLDLTAEQPDALTGTTPPTFDEPDPSPGLRLKIPTN